MIPAFLVALTHALTPAPAGTLQLSDAARVFVRSEQREGAGPGVGLEDVPRLDAGLAWPTTELSLVYEPRFTWLDVGGSDASPTLLLHGARLGLAFQQPRYTLWLEQSGTYGSQDFAPGITTAPTSLDGAPVVTTPDPGGVGGMPSTTPDTSADALDLLGRARVIRVASEETGAGLQYSWSRRWSSELRASFGYSGGADAEARRTLPMQRTTRASTSLDFSRTRRDELSSTVSGAQIHTSNGFDHWLASFVESWSMQWSNSTGSSIGVGATFQDTTTDAGSHASDWVPVGTASLSQSFDTRDLRTKLDWSVGYDSDVNLLIGSLQTRAYGSAQVTFTISRTRLLLGLSAAQTVPFGAPDAARVISADAGLTHELLEWLDAQAGAQITWQRFTGGAALGPQASTWLLYAGLAARAPEQRF